MAEKDLLRLTYKEQEPSPTIPVQGAMGGVAPDGSSVVAHVYVEFATVPSMEEHKVLDGGRVDFTKGAVVRHSELTRQVVATLVMSPEAAIRIGKWLVTTGKNAVKARAINEQPE
jgi:hypothetical protein